MMRVIIFLILISYSSLLFAQKQAFYECLDGAPTDLLPVSEPTQSELDVLRFNEPITVGKFIYHLNRMRSRRGRDTLVQLSVFNQFCNGAMRYFSRNYFRKRSYVLRLLKYTELGLRHLKAPARLFKVVTFEINLIDLSSNRRFYYYRNDTSTELKLFVGKRPKTCKKDAEDYEKPVPVQLLSEITFMQNLFHQVKQQMGAETYSKAYKYVAMAIEVNKNTLHRKKIPSARVIVLFAGSQLYKIRE